MNHPHNTEAESRRELPLFAMAGVAAMLAHYGALVLLVEFARFSSVAASTVGFSLGAIVSYWINHKVSFRSNVRHAVALPRFLAIAAVGVALNGAIMAGAVNRIGVHYLVAQLLATVIVFFWSFAANRRWTF